MKRNFSFWMMAALAIAGISLASCVDPVEPDSPGTDDQGKPEVVAPVFPDAVTKALEAGGSHTIEIEPNVDWEIELKYDRESTGWFWIKDGNSQVYSLRGKAGDKVSVTVCAGEQTDFDKVHSCTLEMTMGGETKTVATFTRGTVSRTFELAYCKIDEISSDYAYNEDVNSQLNYEYEAVLTGDKPEVPMLWIERTQDFRRSILITANFDWRMKSKPEWLFDLKITNGEAGAQVEMDIEGDVMNYPLQDASAELVFCAKDNPDAVYTFTVKIPGCEDIFRISGFNAEIKANNIGEIYESNSMTGEVNQIDASFGVTGSVLGIKGAKLYTFVKTAEGKWDASSELTSWVNVSFGERDVDNNWKEKEWSDDNGVLQNRELNIRLAENADIGNREAYVFAMPAAAAPAQASDIFAGSAEMDKKYEQYVVTHIVQEGLPNPEPDPEPDPDPDPKPDPDPDPKPEPVDPITFQMETEWGQKIPSSMATLVEVTADNMDSLGAAYLQKYGFTISDYCTTSATYVLTYKLENYPAGQQNMTVLHVPNFNGNPMYQMSNPENGKEWLSYEMNENSLGIWMKEPDANASQKFGIIQMFISMDRSYTIICIPEI